MTTSRQEWALALYRRSVIKQAKVRRIVEMLGDTDGKTCLDIGGDNGVVSFLLRERGGRWHSADLDATTVEAIRLLVGPDVQQIDGRETPFAASTFDVVVIVDFLEHIHTDREFAQELERILKPGGTLIVNVPHLKPRSLVNRLRHAIGLTDEKHGHVRPGYSLSGLSDTLGERFTLVASRTYSRAFSELVDAFLNALYELRKKDGGDRSRKGAVVTQDEVKTGGLEFLALGVLYPFLWLATRLDVLMFFQPGYKLIAKYSSREG